MTAPVRVTPKETRRKLESGTALLVCAYDDESKFKQMQLEGGIPLSEFKSRLTMMEKNQEIIFYCAWPNEYTSASLAVKYIEKGYKNTMALLGGVDAWKKEGYPIKSE